MIGYSFELTCPACGGELESTNVGNPVARVEVNAVARCAECNAGWAVHVDVVRIGARVFTPGERDAPSAAECGTESGYTRHRRLDEEPCAPCKQAKAKSDRARKDRLLARKRDGVYA